jgi:hypothetical protein
LTYTEFFVIHSADGGVYAKVQAVGTSRRTAQSSPSTSAPARHRRTDPSHDVYDIRSSIADRLRAGYPTDVAWIVEHKHL